MAQKALGRREYLSEQRVPPTDHARLEMFLDLAADYVSLARTMPMPRDITWGGKPISDTDYWVIVLHATLLRKFFSDQVEVASVVPAVRRLLREDPDDNLMSALAAIEQHASAHDAPTFVALHIGSLAITPWEAAQVLLHGRHVHSDYGKWRYSVGHHYGEIQYVQMWAMAAAEVLRPLVVDLRWAWQHRQFKPDVDLERWIFDDRWSDRATEGSPDGGRQRPSGAERVEDSDV